MPCYSKNTTASSCSVTGVSLALLSAVAQDLFLEGTLSARKVKVPTQGIETFPSWFGVYWPDPLWDQQACPVPQHWSACELDVNSISKDRLVLAEKGIVEELAIGMAD